METLECIKSRRVIRNFRSREVPFDLIQRILEAGRRAPSAKNLQPWCFVVVRNKGMLQAFGPLCYTGSFITDASFAVAVLIDPKNPYAVTDGAMAVENMALAAWNEGVGTCWIGLLDKPKITELLRVPDEWEILTLLPFGYPVDDSPARGGLKPLGEIMHWEKFGSTAQKNWA